MRPIDTIVVHCSATPEGREYDAEDIRRWHLQRGWSDIGYHAVVKLDGTIELGRDLDHDGDTEEHVGAHARGHNLRSLGIVYIGGVDAAMRPKDTRTPAQHKALLRMVKEWMNRFDIRPERVLGHYELDSGKACPSFNMRTFRQSLHEGDKTRSLTGIQIQAALNRSLRLVEDGILGPLTDGALRRFQQVKGLEVTGYIDDQTDAALRMYL